MRVAELEIAVPARPRVPYRGLAVVLALVGVGALTVLSAREFVSELWPSLFAITPTDLLALLPFALWSYGLRVVRWHVLLRRLAPRAPIWLSLHSQLVGFAFAATPGRVAELYKLRIVQRSTGLPPAQTLPAVAVERMTDLAAFGSLAVVGGWLSWTTWAGSGQAVHWAVLGLGVVALAATYHVVARRWSGWQRSDAVAVVREWLRAWLRRFPMASRAIALLLQLKAGARRMASPTTLALAQSFVIAGRIGDAVVIWKVADLVGYHVSFPLAVLLIAAAGLAGGLSLSPGGLGAAEAALVALVYAQGVPLHAAVTIALLSRLLIFWGWILLGLVVFVAGLGLGALGVGRREPLDDAPVLTAGRSR